MKKLKPVIYDSFHCIADACDFTCCKEWKIAVDDAAYEKWKKETWLPSGRKLSSYTKKRDGSRVITLKEDRCCPFLNKKGLCDLVIQYGEEILSDTCTQFPREIHKFEDQIEYTLMPCCPAVIDLLERSDTFDIVEEVAEEAEIVQQQENTSMKVLREIRDFFMSLMKKEAYSCEEALLLIAYYAIDIYETILAKQKEDKENSKWQCSFDFAMHRKEYELWEKEILYTVRHQVSNAKEHFTECNELLLDIMDNYRKEGLYGNLLTAVAEMAEEMEYNYENQDAMDVENGALAKVFSEKQEQLLHKWLTQEIYADLILPDNAEEISLWEQMEFVLIKIQWITMEYIFVRQYCYYQKMRSGALNYEDLRNAIVLGSRMMGYEEEDIISYLENSFEELIWDWGYFALLLIS